MILPLFGKQEVGIWRVKKRFPRILWEAFLDPSDSYFLLADLVCLYTHWTYMHIFRHIFFSNYWWQRSDIWSQASYRYPISWEAFFDPSDSYFLFNMSNVYINKLSRQAGSRNLTGPKMLPTIWHTYMKLVTKYQIPVISSCWDKCDDKWAYMFNVYTNQQSRQTGNRNPIGWKTLPTIWGTYMKLVAKYQISVINSCWEECDEKCAYMFNV
jgi:hypothetical protein